MKNKIIYLLFLLTAIYSCKKFYNPTLSSNNLSTLVVEGYINTGIDSTIINLSRTVVVANKTTANPETKAIVTVENAQGTAYPIPETTRKGVYGVPSLHLDNGKQYRLRIKTSNGKTYLSDLVTPKITPPIDSVGYIFNTTSMHVYANTHDPNNATKYYKYTFRETWQFNAKYITPYISDGVKLNMRTSAQNIYYCYASDTSAHTILSTSAALSQDVIFQAPINDIDATSEKLESKYSILVSQTALTKDAYDFYNNLLKNTESLGSIFDAQPSTLLGNIHNVADASEAVIGYISAGTIQRKRIFIDRSIIPPTYHTTYPYQCEIDTGVTHANDPKYPDVRPLAFSLPVVAYVTDIDIKAGLYFFSTPLCTDCTLRGNVKPPPFWK